MPVVASALLSDLRRQVSSLEADLKQQVEELPELEGSLRDEWQNGRDAGRVGDSFEIWLGEQATQAAVHWVLGCVFVRFLEDNLLIGEALIAGPGERLREAEGREAAYYGEHPLENERDWLLHAFHVVAALPGGGMLFDERHNPIFRWPISPDGAKALVTFWRRQDPGTGALVHDFTDPTWETRFLGDLYQDLSEHAKKKYALLQTPVFVEEFILDRTLGEALRALPLDRVTAIDPTCGSGHFLLGAFSRLLTAWEATEPATRREILAQRTLDQISGVDLNPFAVAIARFRLLIAALRACGFARLKDSPAFRLSVVVGDALLHGLTQTELLLGDERRRGVAHAFSDEDLTAVEQVLGRRYAAVVGNPPYITPKDKALNGAYRERYSTCHRQYALSVPFVERFWELASSDLGGGVPGWVGQITANSFMKREFGRKLIEEFLPTVDLTHVIDTAGAYIPGHGTPTVILFGRARRPATDLVRAVMGLQGEPATPADPASGVVWTSILAHVDRAGTRDSFVESLDLPRGDLAGHPWTIASGEHTALKRQIEIAGEVRLDEIARAIGFQQDTHADAAFVQPTAFFQRLGIAAGVRPHVRGEDVRDWASTVAESIVFPFDSDLREWREFPVTPAWWWFHALRTVLWDRAAFAGGTYRDNGIPWFAYHQFPRERARIALSLSYGEVATHNHFVLDRGGVVFSRTAPVIKFAEGTADTLHLGILGLLNSSTGCFWLKQVAHNKGSTVDQAGARQRTAPFEDFYQFSAGKIGAFPVTREKPASLAGALDALAREREALLPKALQAHATPTGASLDAARQTASDVLAQMVALQEELDWSCYGLYGLVEQDLTYRDASGAQECPPAVALGERAFEIVLARRIAAGDEDSTWFARHNAAPVTELPARWPSGYRSLVERRIAAIESGLNVALIERPEYKRRWNLESWEALEKVALGAWLLDRLESRTYWPDISPQTTRDLASRATLDPEFGAVAALWAGDAGADMESVIRRLVIDEAVPCLSATRYSDTGAVKRAVWERTWELQRQEDALYARVASEVRRFEEESDDAYRHRLAAAQKARREAEMDPIERPPKYASKDFANATYWKLRGTLDVPKERFILYPFANRAGDDAPLVGWAGWDHLQQAQALAALYVERTQADGWQGSQVIPLLAGVAELVPWLKQWHNQVDPEYGQRLGDFYATWLEEELRTQGLTRAALANWRPPESGRGRRRRA